MKDILKPIPCLIMIIVILLLVSISKINHTNILNEKLETQQNLIHKIYEDTGYKHVDSLYMEIMYLGSRLDSMIIKYDN
tara:strand:+ start:357 stop:593 length:237 start_codon:yes stop_codon:yes gene_type:complete